MCFGAIIGPKDILTSARCVMDENYQVFREPLKLVPIFGQINFESESTIFAGYFEILIDKIYTPMIPVQDLAVIKVFRKKFQISK